MQKTNSTMLFYNLASIHYQAKLFSRIDEDVTKSILTFIWPRILHTSSLEPLNTASLLQISSNSCKNKLEKSL